MRHQKEQGAIMLEGMIVMVITMIMLVWILAIGFIYYQKYLVTITTNDVAVKIAATYANPSSDIVMGYMTGDEIANRNIYRNLFGGDDSLLEIQGNKASKYVVHMLKKTNFAGVVDESNIHVDLKLIDDSWTRKHVEVTTECTFNTPFNIALDYFGMGKTTTYKAAACADCTDIIDYISTVEFAHSMSSLGALGSKSVKIINQFVSIYNRVKYE